MLHHLEDTQRGGVSLKDASMFLYGRNRTRLPSGPPRRYSHRRLCPRDLRGTHQRTSSGRGAGRRCCRWTSLLLFPDSDTCRNGINRLGFSVEFEWPQQCVCVCVWHYRSAIATAAFFSLSLLDWGALTCAMTGLRSLFINSNTLSGFYSEENEGDIGEFFS